MFGRNSLLGFSGAMLALSSLAASPASAGYDPNPLCIIPADLGAGPGPIHRRGRFKRNQRLQRKQGRRK